MVQHDHQQELVGAEAHQSQPHLAPAGEHRFEASRVSGAQGIADLSALLPADFFTSPVKVADTPDDAGLRRSDGNRRSACRR